MEERSSGFKMRFTGIVLILLTIVAANVSVAYEGPQGNGLDGSDQQTSPSEQPMEQQLLVLMLDGFRWDYFDKLELPGFQAMFEEGVRAKWVEPIFPTVSYPSWTTLSTGLYAENHNIVGNYFWDIENQWPFALFNYSTTKRTQWWAGIEPIWVTAKKNNKKVATHYWSRSDVELDGIRLDYASGFYSKHGVAQVRDVFRRSLQSLVNDGCHLVMSYVEHIDNVGHESGPESPAMLRALQDVDDEIAKFRRDIIKSGKQNQINMVIVADHGMRNVGPGSGVQVIQMSDYLSVDDVQAVLDRGAFIAIIPFANRKEKVFNDLKNMPGANVYKKEDIPERYHYAKSRLVQDILIVAKEGYYIQGLAHARQIPRADIRYFQPGLHGYDPQEPDMRPIFVAAGPQFVQNRVHDPIRLVDIYQVYGHVLDIPRLPPHNGSWERVAEMFKSAGTTSVSPISAAVLSLCSIMVLVSYH